MMGTRLKVAIVFGVASLLTLSACAGSPSSSTSASSATASVSSASSASSASSTSSASSASNVAPDAPTTATIRLDRAAGTGFEWVCSIEPEGIIEQTGHTTESASDNKTAAGGPLRDTYTFSPRAPGEAVITFKLERSWEKDNAAETQVYAYTVTDDLRMVLNPYKSVFTSEPE